MGEYSLLLAGWDQADWLEVHTALLGFLLVTNEANLLIRYILQRYLLQPGRPSGREDQLAVGIGFLERALISIQAFGYLFQPGHSAPRDEASGEGSAWAVIGPQEFNTGRIIGILKRALIYALVLNEQYAAIGLILAAKSFTRYKELENRAFAGYLLVGALPTTLLAVLAAELARLLLGRDGGCSRGTLATLPANAET